MPRARSRVSGVKRDTTGVRDGRHKAVRSERWRVTPDGGWLGGPQDAVDRWLVLYTVDFALMMCPSCYRVQSIRTRQTHEDGDSLGGTSVSFSSYCDIDAQLQLTGTPLTCQRGLVGPGAGWLAGT
jgi:hypothetical protein